MNYRTLFVAVLAVISLVFAGVPVAAQSPDDTSSVMTDAHVQRIKQNCRAATRTIQQLHLNDGPLRVNRGQVYDSVSTKLMTSLNSRLIVNKLDASSLVKVTARYDKTLTDFREDYKKYDNQVSAVLDIDCTKQPVSFYDAVRAARQLRTAVHNDATKLHALIGEYSDAFKAFRQQFDAGRGGESE